MSYDPTERAQQPPDQQPPQSPVMPSAYGQPPQQPPAQPNYGQIAPTQYAGQPPAYTPMPSQPTPPAAPYGQPSSPSLPPYGGQTSNPALPQYGQPGQASNPALPQYGQPGQPSNPAFPQYGQPGQPSNPALPQYGQPGQPSNPAFPQYGQPGQPSSPTFPQYGQPGQASNPALPQYGQPGQPSNPALPQYGQPSSPTFPQYGQPSSPVLPQFDAPPELYPQQPGWGAAVPPGFAPQSTPPRRSGARAWIIILVIVLVLAGAGGGGYAFYISTRPKPVISVTSQYLDGTTAVGATSTTFALKGTDFTSSSAITFLLDGNTAPDVATVQSDSNGAVTATLTVTSNWTVGIHTLTAKDAAGYTTTKGVKIEIVTPGQAKTPGPNGAPTDSANMVITDTVTVSGQQGTPETLNVTGSPSGGTVCGTQDNGQPHSYSGSSGSLNFTVTVTYSCSGTYKSGKLTYTETATTYQAVFSDGVTCTASSPVVVERLDGTFSNATNVSGSYGSDPYTLSCDHGVGDVPSDAQTGTFAGTAVVQ